MDMAGKVALVTGGGARVGRALCEALAGRGCAVVIHYRRSQKEARELARRLEAAGGRARAIPGALDTQAGCERLVSRAFKAFGRLDMLVNNASSFERTEFRNIRGSELDSVFSINLKAHVLLTRAFVELARRGAGLPARQPDSGARARQMAYLLSSRALADYARGRAGAARGFHSERRGCGAAAGKGQRTGARKGARSAPSPAGARRCRAAALFL